MKKIKIIIGLLVIMFSLGIQAQSERKLVRSGNSEYEDGNFTEAEVQYRKALDQNPNYFNGKFNLGDAMYEQENYEESGKLFNELTEAKLTDEQKAGAFYNLGNTFLKAQKYQESIDAYKKSLRLKPDDYDAKYNLEYARKMQADQQQNQDQNQDQDQDKKDQDKEQDQKEDQNKDQDKDQDQKDQDKEQDKQDQKNDQNKNDKSDQNQDQKQQPQPQQISKQDAQRMLDALKNDEKATLQKLQKEKAKAVKGGKSEIDW